MPKATVSHRKSRKNDSGPRSGREETPSTRLCQQALAKRWGLSPKTLERWRGLGIGPVYIRLPGKVVYRVEDVEAFERSSLRQGTDESFLDGGAA